MRLLFAAAIASLLLAGCHTVPPFEPAPITVPQPSKPVIVRVQGPLQAAIKDNTTATTTAKQLTPGTVDKLGPQLVTTLGHQKTELLTASIDLGNAVTTVAASDKTWSVAVAKQNGEILALRKSEQKLQGQLHYQFRIYMVMAAALGAIAVAAGIWMKNIEISLAGLAGAGVFVLILLSVGVLARWMPWIMGSAVGICGIVFAVQWYERGSVKAAVVRKPKVATTTGVKP